MSGRTGSEPARRSLWPAARLIILAIALVAAALALWQLKSLLLLVFGAILVAVLLRALSDLIADHTPLGDRLALAAAIIIIAGILAGFAAVVGSQLAQQFSDLITRVPSLLERLQDRLGISDMEGWIEERLSRMMSAGGVLSSIAGYSSLLAGAIANVLLVTAAGIYLAIDPGLYKRGFLQLVPRDERDETAEVVDTLANALKLWLVGQLASMILVGTMTTLGLWLLGIQSALALGFIAGLLEFVPFVGPALSAVPAIALALANDPVSALWVLGLYILVQQIEGNLITPLVQQRTVDLPPVVTIFAIVGVGILFGPLGILFATPFTVVCFVLVKKLWVNEALGKDTDVPGEPEPQQAE